MSLSGCGCALSCTARALVSSALVGITAAFLQITGTITVTAAFLWAALGIAVVYLGLALVSAALSGTHGRGCCFCGAVNTLLAAILGTILFSLVLLAVGITATGVVSAILVGLLLFFLALVFTATACLVRCLTDCERMTQ